jgi:hypothetical protein
VSVAVAGAAAGAMQWLVLRHWVTRAGWWVLAASFSWVATTYVYAYVTRANDVRLALGGAASGALSGAITGIVLVWLMRGRQRVGTRLSSAKRLPPLSRYPTALPRASHNRFCVASYLLAIALIDSFSAPQTRRKLTCPPSS